MTPTEAVALLRRAAPVVRKFGFIHAAIADGLLADADAIEAGRIMPAEVPESINLARTYLDGEDS